MAQSVIFHQPSKTRLKAPVTVLLKVLPVMVLAASYTRIPWFRDSAKKDLAPKSWKVWSWQLKSFMHKDREMFIWNKTIGQYQQKTNHLAACLSKPSLSQKMAL